MEGFLYRAKNIFHPGRRRDQELGFTDLFSRFQNVLELNNQVLEHVAEMGDKLGGDYVFDIQYIRSACQQIADLVHKLIYNLDTIAPKKYVALYEVFNKINGQIEEELAGKLIIPQTDYTMPYSLISRDFSDVVGAKNANLAEVKNFLGLSVPDGFAITTRAFQVFMDHNRLWEKIRTVSETWQEGKLSSEAAAKEIQGLTKRGAIPHYLKKELQRALERLHEGEERKSLYLAIRSSAWGEDSEHTFAGQFLSLLNEPAERLLNAYRAVVASAYSTSAMEYRRQKGYSEQEVAMAVACQVMVDAKVSGVLYSLDPQAPERELMTVAAIWGLGAPMVAGEVTADQFNLLRDPPHRVEGLHVVRKVKSLVPMAGGGTQFRPVPDQLQTRACLSVSQLKTLAETALMIERYFKKPQDIEFAFDRAENLFILQSRPLNIKAQVAGLVCDISSAVKHYPVIFSGKGSIAQKGIGSGKVFMVKSDEDLDAFPQGAILVARHTSPRFAQVIRKANAILTDVGSPTGHMATIAREFRVPAIVNTGIATQMLKHGQELTVDAEENVIYEGKVKELCYYEFTEEAFEDTYEYRLLRRVLKKISPLNLLDPHDKNFTALSCKTFHDITRFIHEKAIEEIIDLNYYADDHSKTTARKLKLGIPLDLVLIDIGGGLKGETTSPTVEVDEIDSIPMAAFLEGLTAPRAWSAEPMSVDFGSFMSSLTRTFSLSLASPRFVGQNLAVMSLEYTNIALRLGYHFNMIDAHISENMNDNYAYFRFLGGVTDLARRSRRAKLIAEILGINHFRVDLRGDLVVARIKKLDLEQMKRKMRLLGLLVAFTRQLDVQMASELHIPKFIEDFNQLKTISLSRR